MKKEQSSENKRIPNLLSISFTIFIIIGILACFICNKAISGSLTWSLLPISSCIFAWLVLIPVFGYGKKGIVGTLSSFSLLIIPFLWIINKFVGNNQLIMPIGMKVSVVSIMFLWGVYITFRSLKGKKMIAAAISFLLAIPADILINYSISKEINTPVFDIWDLTSVAFLLLSSSLFFMLNKISGKTN